MKSFTNYLSASYAEIKKVVWPSRRKTVQLTVVVIVFAVTLAFVLGLIDLGFSTLLQKLITKG